MTEREPSWSKARIIAQPLHTKYKYLRPDLVINDHRSFLPTGARQPQQKLERYAQLYAKYTNAIQLQGNAMRHDMEGMQRAYDQVAAEFAMEQHSANNKMGAPFVLADLNEYARRFNKTPNSFEE